MDGVAHGADPLGNHKGGASFVTHQVIEGLPV